jgi:hypothetical protein
VIMADRFGDHSRDRIVRYRADPALAREATAAAGISLLTVTIDH